MRTMIELITDLSAYRSGVVCDGLDALTIDIQRELPFTVHEFASGLECNGWTVPWSWNVHTAQVWDQRGALVTDGNAHPLGVVSYGDAFHGAVDGKNLKDHLFYHNGEGFEDELVYHCRFWLQPHNRTWGLCVPKTLHDSINEDESYLVDIDATFEPGTMKVAEYVLHGESTESVVLLAHDCHAGTANDDLSGIAVGIEVIRRLAKLPRRRYTYRLLVSPEHLGPVFWLQRFGSEHLRHALFLESLGTTGPLALQESFTGKADIDNALRNALRGRKHYTGEFRSIVGNCETVLEAKGIEVPCPSLSRCPFDAYHSSLDNAGLMSEEHLNEAVDVVFDALMALDLNVTTTTHTRGLVCLSNPKYDLYQPFADPSVPALRTIPESAVRFNKLMNWLPRYFDGRTTALEIAERFELPFSAVRDYLSAWEAKGLVELRTAT